MPNFRYQSLSSAGEARNGIVTAEDRAEVVRLLLDRGETATRVEAADGGASASRAASSAARKGSHAHAAPARRAFGISGRPSLGRGDLATFIREIATALEAGLPLMQSLRTVRRQAHGRALPVILDHLIERVEAGDPLYAAARDYGAPFDEMVVGMMKAADASGEMSTILHQLSDLLDRGVELRREVVGATFYPMIVFGLLIISVIVLVTVLVPRLISPMIGQSTMTIPWPTLVLLSIAEFFHAWWPVIVGAIIAGWFGWQTWIRVPANRLSFDRFSLRVPVLGRLLRDVAVARFTRTLGTLSKAGLPILDGLRITRNTLGNQALMSAIDQVLDQVTAGKALADPLERSGLFPPLLVQVVSLGERSGKLDSMLLHAAGAFDRQVQTSLKLFTKALPPFLLIIMAGLGGFVLAAVLLPMLELQSMVS